MKKTLLAAALAATGFAGVAQAQTSVTLFGILDTGVGYARYKVGNAKATKTGAVDGIQSGNRWGLRGSEDLGGGLKATFWLESGFSLLGGQSQQGPRLFGRQAWLALENDVWGKLAFGRQLNYASQWVGGVAVPWNDSFNGSNSGSTFTSTNTIRADNTISYTTPVFSGFQFGLGYSFNVDGAQIWDQNVSPNPKNANVELTTVGLRYNNGPLAVAASYDHVDIDTILQPTGKDVTAWVLAASYDFDVAKLHVGVGQERHGTLGNRLHGNEAFFIPGLETDPFENKTGYKATNYSLGVGFPLSSDSSIAVAWQSSRLGSGAYKNTVKLNILGDTSQNLYSVVYQYNLSARTNLYANVGYGDGIAFIDQKMTRAVVGLRHRF